MGEQRTRLFENRMLRKNVGLSARK